MYNQDNNQYLTGTFSVFCLLFVFKPGFCDSVHIFRIAEIIGSKVYNLFKSFTVSMLLGSQYSPLICTTINSKHKYCVKQSIL